MRHKLIPSKRGLGGWYKSWFVHGRETALDEARDFYEAEGVTVLVVEAPEGDGLIHAAVANVGLKEERAKLKRARVERRAA